MNESRTALVLGGTGHVGHALLRELCARCYRVRALTRQARPHLLEELDVEVVRGDADVPGDLQRAIGGVDIVVDAAAPYALYLPQPGQRALDPRREAALRTARLCAAVERQNATLVFISSFTTLPRPQGAWSTLEVGLRRAMHPYFTAKEAMERVVLEACERGLRAVLINPTACLGPWDGKPRSLCYLPLLVSGEVPATTSHVVNVIDVRDVASGAVAALEAEVFGTPLLFGGHDIRADELAARACALVGRRPPLLRTSIRAAATAAYWTEWLFAATGRRAPIPSLPWLLACEVWATGVGEAQRALGAWPRPLEDTLRDSLAWYRRLGYLA
ncbi:MAG: NAD-dependent epimerase/dehydratase family protein [Byssovorax sp.]